MKDILARLIKVRGGTAPFLFVQLSWMPNVLRESICYIRRGKKEYPLLLCWSAQSFEGRSWWWFHLKFNPYQSFITDEKQKDFSFGTPLMGMHYLDLGTFAFWQHAVQWANFFNIICIKISPRPSPLPFFPFTSYSFFPFLCSPSFHFLWDTSTTTYTIHDDVSAAASDEAFA